MPRRSQRFHRNYVEPSSSWRWIFILFILSLCIGLTLFTGLLLIPISMGGAALAGIAAFVISVVATNSGFDTVLENKNFSLDLIKKNPGTSIAIGMLAIAATVVVLYFAWLPIVIAASASTLSIISFIMTGFTTLSITGLLLGKASHWALTTVSSKAIKLTTGETQQVLDQHCFIKTPNDQQIIIVVKDNAYHQARVTATPQSIYNSKRKKKTEEIIATGHQNLMEQLIDRRARGPLSTITEKASPFNIQEDPTKIFHDNKHNSKLLVSSLRRRSTIAHSDKEETKEPDYPENRIRSHTI